MNIDLMMGIASLFLEYCKYLFNHEFRKVLNSSRCNLRTKSFDKIQRSFLLLMCFPTPYKFAFAEANKFSGLSEIARHSSVHLTSAKPLFMYLNYSRNLLIVHCQKTDKILTSFLHPQNLFLPQVKLSYCLVAVLCLC